MRRLFSVFVFIISLVLSGCSENIIISDPGEPTTMEFEIKGNYAELDISNSFDVYVDKDAIGVTITAGENVMPYVIVEENNGELKICLKPFTILRSGDLKAVVPYSKKLKDVSLSGASSFHCEIPLVDESISVEASGASKFLANVDARFAELELSGASSFKGNVLASELELSLSGASKADIIGVAEILELELSGASKIFDNVLAGRYCLACRRCKGSISGASSAYIHCDEAIDVSVSGASKLYYTGDASTSGSSTSGSSIITHEVF